MIKSNDKYQKHVKAHPERPTSATHAHINKFPPPPLSFDLLLAFTHLFIGSLTSALSASLLVASRAIAAQPRHCTRLPPGDAPLVCDLSAAATASATCVMRNGRIKGMGSMKTRMRDEGGEFDEDKDVVV